MVTPTDHLVLQAIASNEQLLDLSDRLLRTVPEPLIAAGRIAIQSKGTDTNTRRNAMLILRPIAKEQTFADAEGAASLDEAIATLRSLCEQFLACASDDSDTSPDDVSHDVLSGLTEAVPLLASLGNSQLYDEVVTNADAFGDHCAVGDWRSAGICLTHTLSRLSTVQRTLNASIVRKAKRFCRQLAVLDLSGNTLTDLPVELAAFRGLKRLDVSNNQLSDIPDEIVGPLLQQINAGRNKLTRLPINCMPHPTLLSLLVGDNELTRIESDVFACPSLTTLDVGFNGITNLPALTSPTTIRNLILADNPIRRLPNLTAFKCLETLQCGNTYLQKLPAKLPSTLRHLDVSECELHRLPDSRRYYKHLAYLNVSSNKLVSLPFHLTEADRSSDIVVEGNPLSRTMLSAAAEGTEALLSYLKSLGEATRPCREAKLILIGEGNVGKSSIVAALAGEPFVENRPTTHGIEIRSLTLYDESRELNVQLNTWDFGGQEIYRVTHQFYLSQDAVFLIVWRPREGFEQSGIAFWLDRVRRLVGNRGTVILVSTYAEEGRQTHIDLEELQYRYYPLIKGWVHVDNKSGRGVRELHEQVASAAMSLDHIEDPLAESWLALRNDVMEVERPFVSRQEYDALAKERRVEGGAASAWLRLLHALGQLIYFERDIDLSTIVVVDPEILAQAVSYVLEDLHVIESGGRVSHEYLVNLWAERLGPIEGNYSVFPYLLRLMEKNDISFRYPDSRSSLIAPVIPHHRPLDLPWEPGDPLPEGFYELRAYCVFGSDPVGLMPWLTVRSNRWAEVRMWRAGLFIVGRSGEATAQVEFVDDRRLFICVRGAYPNELFSVLRSEVEWLVSSRWPYVDLEITIPCPSCRSLRGPSAKGQFVSDALLRAASLSISHLQCSECFESVAVLDMLAGFNVGSQEAAGDRFALLDARLEAFCTSSMELLSRSSVVAERAVSVNAELTEHVREVRKTVSLVAADCPRLFSLVPDNPSGVSPRRLWREAFRLQLWCEESGGNHPVGEPYVFTRPREWFVRAAPLVRTMLRLLRLVPVVSAAMPQIVDAETWRKVETELESMAALSEALWDLEADGAARLGRTVADRLTSGGYELRVVKELLLELDPQRVFGGLSQVLAEGGDVLWVCPAHYRRHNPGLPELPMPRTSN